MNPKFWQGKRVFLTGHTGFKGAWLALWLEKLGAVVHGYALEPEESHSLFHVARVVDALEHEIGDVRDLSNLSAAVHKFRPDAIIHMAAQSLVRRSYDSPSETFAVNVMGTVNVLEAARHSTNTRATVIVTSDKCYENDGSGRPFVEADAMGGRDPYSGSKGAAELAISSYARSFFGPGSGAGSLASVRAGNAIGGGDWAKDRILPDIFRNLLAGTVVEIRNPHTIRPWLHVLESLSGYLEVTERLLRDGPAHWEAWNFGPKASSERSVEEIARTCCELWPRRANFKLASDASQRYEAPVLRLDSTKAHSFLGWCPRWELEEALRQIVDWYRRYGDGEDMKSVSLEQIANYERTKSG